MFKRIRKFYKRNRIYCILMLVSFICLAVLGTSLVIYFYNQATGDPYGTRLDQKEQYPLNDSLKNTKKFFDESKGVLKSNIFEKGNIIYLDITVEKDLTVEKMQNMATSSLENFDEGQLGYYDLQFSFIREGYPAYTGSKSAQNTVISWSVYNLDYDKEETTTTAKKK